MGYKYQGKAFISNKTDRVRLFSGATSVSITDEVLRCDTTAGVVDIDLFEIPEDWDNTYKLCILDYGTDGTDGIASVNNIWLYAPAGTKINGLDEIAISENRASCIVTIIDDKNYHVEISTGEGFDNYIEKTHNELTTLISNSGLTEGAFYLITDFQTIYIQPDFYYSGDPKPINLSMIKTGDTEPIVVIATSNHTVSSQAWSIIHSEEFIEYDVRKEIIYQDFCSGNTVETKGKITRRIDDVGNDIPLDFRQVLFKRYGVIPDSNETSDIYQSFKESIKNEFEPLPYEYGNNYGYSIFVNNKFYITNYSGSLFILDFEFNLIDTKSIPGFTLSYNETLKRLYVGSYNSFSSYYIDTETDTVVEVIWDIPRRTDGIIYNPINNKVYGVRDGGDEIHVFDSDLNFINTIDLSSIIEDSPVGTLWNSDLTDPINNGWGDLTNYQTRTYGTFLEATGGDPTLVGKELVMYDTFNNKYYKVIFTDWNDITGGAFTYERELIIDPITFGPVVSFTKTNYGNEIDYIDTNLSITRANNMLIYNSTLQKSSKGSYYLNNGDFGSFYSLTVNKCNGDVWVQDYNWAYYVVIDVNDELVFVYNIYKPTEVLGINGDSLFSGGTNYYIDTNIPTSGGSGVGMTVDINYGVDPGGVIPYWFYLTINNNGTGYQLDDIITINQVGSDNNASFSLKTNLINNYNNEGLDYNPENGKIYVATNDDLGSGDIVIFDANNRSYETSIRMKDVVTSGVSYIYRVRFSESKVIISMEDINGYGAIVKINKDNTFLLVTDADLNGTRTIPSNAVDDCILVNGQYLFASLIGWPNPNFYSYYVVELNTNYFEQTVVGSKTSYNGGEIFNDGDAYKSSINNNVFRKIGDLGPDIFTQNDEQIFEILNSYNIWRFNSVIQSPFLNNLFSFNCVNNTFGVRPTFNLPFNLQSKGNIIGGDFENNVVYAGFSFNQILGDVSDCEFYLTQSPSKFFRYNSIIAPLNNINFGGDPVLNDFSSTNIVYKTIQDTFTTEIINNINNSPRIRYTGENDETIISTIN